MHTKTQQGTDKTINITGITLFINSEMCQLFVILYYYLFTYIKTPTIFPLSVVAAGRCAIQTCSPLFRTRHNFSMLCSHIRYSGAGRLFGCNLFCGSMEMEPFVTQFLFLLDGRHQLFPTQYVFTHPPVSILLT